MTEDGIKTTGRDAGVVPRTVIYDPDLTRSLPLGMTVASGLNAIAHCMEGLYAVDGNPIVSMMAEEGIRSLYESLPRLVEDGGDRSEEHTSELQSLMRNSYDVFCMKKKTHI